MSAPTRFPSGVTNRAVGHPFANFPAPDPTRMFQALVDFTGLDYLTSAWTVTETQAGATQNLAASDASGEYGLLALVNTAGASDINSIQLTTAGLFLGDTSKRWWLRGRMSRDNADLAIGLGLQAANATPFTVANGLFMRIAAASTDATFGITKASASTTATGSAAYPTSALNTFVDLAMAYDGKSQIECFVGGIKVARITDLTNLPNTAALTLTVSSQNSTANARNAHCDYLFFAVER